MGQLMGTVQTIFGEPGRFVHDLDKYSKVKLRMCREYCKSILIPKSSGSQVVVK
jgi:hypothetical protein